MRIDYHDDILIEVARLGREAMGRVTASMASRQLGEAFAGLAGRRKSAKMRGKDRREQTRLPRDYRRGARVVAHVVDQAAHHHAEVQADLAAHRHAVARATATEVRDTYPVQRQAQRL